MFVYSASTKNLYNVYKFKGGNDGASPLGLIQDTCLRFYGATLYGGAAQSDGTVFKVTQQGVETVLYRFTGGADGGIPSGGLVRDSGGHFYGATEIGGADNFGVIFQITP